MAPTLTSNSFLLSTTPRSRLATRNPKFIILAAQRSGPLIPFGLGGGSKQDGSSSSEESNDNPFSKLQGMISDVKSLVPMVKQSSSGLSFGNAGRRKDAGTVFVVGATGQAGIRIAKTLLCEGFTVRAAVPDLGVAQELARLASTYKIISPDESKRLIAVGSTFQDAESIAKVIGNATKVVVTVGPAENGPTTEVTLSDALLVIEASQLAGVDHVAVIYDNNSNRTANNNNNNVLNGISSFFNNIFSRSQPLTVKEFLEKVVETDVTYTLIKTKLTEDYSPESSYNVTVAAEGSTSTNDYNVARSQIASLVADVFSNTAVAENKVVEVSTNPSAPLKPISELFSVIPEDGRRKAYADAIAKAKAEEEAIKASEMAREAAVAAKQLEQEVKKLSEQEARATSLAQEAKQKAEAAGTSMESLINKAKKGITENSSGLSWQNLGSQFVNAVQKSSEEIIPKVQVATVRGQAKARNLPAKKAVVKQPTAASKKGTKPKVSPEPTGEEREERKLFGGLFKQEVIYMDD